MSTTVKWGLITGMVYVIFSLLGNMLGIQRSGGFSIMGLALNTAVFIATMATIYLGTKENRDQNLGGYMTFGQGFKTGLGIALIASLITAVFTLIYMTLIDPNMAADIMETVEESWDKQGMPEENREVARKWTEFMFKPWFMGIMVIISVIFWGVIKSLITSAMLKKEAPPTVPTA